MSIVAKITCLSCGQINRVPVARLDASPKCAKCGGPLMSGFVAELDAQLHNKITGQDEIPIIIDYWALWCGPCPTMAPDFAKAALKLKTKVRFAKIDTEQHPEISQKLGIRGIPLLILYSGGKEVGSLAGARPASDIEAFVLQTIKAEGLSAARK
ncbi:MAG: thioredoxin domain-containing protein [Sulfitobacter sp.]